MFGRRYSKVSGQEQKIASIFVAEQGPLSILSFSGYTDHTFTRDSGLSPAPYLHEEGLSRWQLRGNMRKGNE